MEQLTQPEAAALQAISFAARELREPLSGILCALEQLSNAVPEDKSLEIGQINRRLFQMMRMLNNMSDAFSCHSQQAPPMALYNISSLFAEFLSGIPELVSKSGRKFHFTGISSDIFSLVNRDLLERGVYNLISNAIKFSPENSLITAALSKKGNRFCFTVKNTVPDSLSKIPFYNSSQSNGVGLGMSIIQAAASAHGGTSLFLRPKPHIAQITMSLPVRLKETSASKQPPLQADYAGNLDHSLLELSDSLPSSAFEKIW